MYAMTFDAEKEYGNVIDGAGFESGIKYIEAIIEDAKKTLPPNTEFSFISWTDEGKRRCGWVYNLQRERPQQKLFNPLQAPLKT